jgi:signal transduction histidine kinase
VWSKLPDGSANFLNQRFREYTGLSVEEGLGWGWMMKAFHPEDRAEEEWRAAFAAGQPFEKEARITAITEIVNDGARASNEIIQEVITLLRNELTRNRVYLSTELAADLPRVQGDPVQLQQVLTNLTMNAVEAMRTSTDRTRELRISSAKNQDDVLVQVQDSGPGIEPELADRIFEPFFTTRRKESEWGC